MSRRSRRNKALAEKKATPPAVKRATGRLQVTQTESFSGPLPHPEILVRYDQAFPGCAERIVAMTEAQSTHRRSIESAVINANIRNERVGQILSFVLFLVGLIAGTFLLYNDKNTSGLIALVASLIGPAGLYIYSDRRKANQLLAKWRDLIAQRPKS